MKKKRVTSITIEPDAALTHGQFEDPPRLAADGSPVDDIGTNFSAVVAIFAIVVALVSLTGWRIEEPFPAYFPSDLRSMSVNGALATFFLGVFVLIWSKTSSFAGFLTACVFASAAALVTFAEVFRHMDIAFLDVGGLIFSGRDPLLFPKRIALIPCLVFVLLMLSIAVQSFQTQWIKSLRLVLLLAALTVSGGAVLAYLYDMKHFQDFVQSTKFPLPTAASQVALSLGLLMAASHPGKAGMTSTYPLITRLTWRIMLVFGPLSILIGALAARVVADNKAEPGTALAATTIATIILLSLVLARNTRILRLRTQQRDEAEQALGQSEARLRLAQTAAGIATVDWDIAGERAVWSSNFLKVFRTPGIPEAATTPYENFIGLVHPDDRPRIDAMHLKLLKTGGTFNDEFRIKTADGEIRWIATRGEVLCDAKGIPRRMIGSNFDITERRRNENKLTQTLAIIELANDAGEIGIWNNDIAARKGAWDERARAIFGLPSDSDGINFQAFWDIIHRDDLRRVKSTLAQALKSGEKFALECRISHPERSLRWVRIRGQADLDPLSRRAVRMTGIVFDITERREREAHLRFLLREITHRSKNLLAVIQAMARQTGSAAASLEDFQTRFSARLQGLAASHDLLVTEDWHGAFMSDIVRAQIGPFADLIGERITLSGERLQLKPEAAQNIGLALHELTTNAAKYGSLANSVGKVDICWSVVSGANGDSRLKVVWRESGGPIVMPPARRGFGSIVTERIVARALEGNVALEFVPHGVTWTLEIPASYIFATQNTAHSAILQGAANSIPAGETVR